MGTGTICEFNLVKNHMKSKNHFVITQQQTTNTINFNRKKKWNTGMKLIAGYLIQNEYREKREKELGTVTDLSITGENLLTRRLLEDGWEGERRERESEQMTVKDI